MKRSTSLDSSSQHKGSVPNNFAGSTNMDHRISIIATPKEANTTSRKKKGFLASIDAILRTILFPAYMAFCVLLITAYVKLELSDTWTKVIIGGMPIALTAVGVLACLNASLKNSESIDGAAFQIVKWLLLPVVIFLPTSLLWTSLCIMAGKISIWFVCGLGSIIDLAILFVWYWHFYIELPKILKSINEEDSAEEDFFTGLDRANGYVVRISHLSQDMHNRSETRRLCALPAALRK